LSRAAAAELVAVGVDLELIEAVAHHGLSRFGRS
jgi:hypothetical protein